MREQPEERTRPSFTSLIAFGMILTVVYVLAPGPLEHFGPVDDDRFWAIYLPAFSPVIWVYNEIPVVEAFYDWYFGLWSSL